MTPDQIFLYVNNRRVSLAELAKNANDARTVYASGCTGLTALPDLPNARTVYARGCTGLTALPDLPSAEYVDASGCTFDKTDSNFRYFMAGCDSRGYFFETMCIRGQWRYIAGCRNYNLSEALQHWGPGGESDRPDCLELVKKLATMNGEMVEAAK